LLKPTKTHAKKQDDKGLQCNTPQTIKQTKNAPSPKHRHQEFCKPVNVSVQKTSHFMVFEQCFLMKLPQTFIYALNKLCHKMLSLCKIFRR